MIDRIDHFVLTVKSLDATLEFYRRVLGLRHEMVADKFASVHFGRQKINIHEVGNGFPAYGVAGTPTPGSGDFCVITMRPIAEIVAHLEACGVALEDGPVGRTGAEGPMVSVYFRDPDNNLVEIARYDA